MTVAELISLLEDFPPELPVFFSPDAAGCVAVAPKDAVMNLVHPGRGEVIADDATSTTSQPGFVDSLVIYPTVVRDVTDRGADEAGTDGMSAGDDAPVCPASTEIGCSATEGLGALGGIDEGTQRRICQLLEAFPSVRVVWCQPAPGMHRFGLAVADARILARVIHLACAINMPMVAEIDWACSAAFNHDAPDCVRYDLRVPIRTLTSNDDLADINILEQVLVRELARLGLNVPDCGDA